MKSSLGHVKEYIYLECSVYSMQSCESIITTMQRQDSFKMTVTEKCTLKEKQKLRYQTL